jgi:hypothetical protein
MNRPKPSRAGSHRRFRVEHSRKRVRAYLHGALVADTTRPLLVWENPHYPTYYLPAADSHRPARPGRTKRPARRGRPRRRRTRAGRQRGVRRGGR